MGNKSLPVLLTVLAIALLTGCGSPSDETAPPPESSSQPTQTDWSEPTQGGSLPNNVVDGKPEDDTVHTDDPDISDLE